MNIKLSIPIVLSILLYSAAIYVGYLWYSHPDGNYEPITFILLAVASIILLMSKLPVLRKSNTSTPVEILEQREKIKKEFERNVPPKDGSISHGRAIIRDINRMDQYPDVDSKNKGISPWFRLEIKGTYHRGIEFFMRVVSVKYEPECKAWRMAEYEEEESENAFLVGRILFENIVKTIWEGDRYYPEPHFYCQFSTKKKEPYEKLLLYRKGGEGEHIYFLEIAEYYAALKLQQKIARG